MEFRRAVLAAALAFVPGGSALAEFSPQPTPTGLRCLDESGREGLNPATPEELFRRQAAPCADLRSADLRGAELTDADLRGADLSKADLRGAVLDGADLSGARLEKANLGPFGRPATPTSLRGTRLPGADLTGATLCSADFFRADLRGARLPRSWSKLTGVDLSGADVRGTDLSAIYLPFVFVAGARYDAETVFASNISRGAGLLGRGMTPESRGMVNAEPPALAAR